MQQDDDEWRHRERELHSFRRVQKVRVAQAQQVRAFAAKLGSRSGRPVDLQDERLTSREAEQRLALRERDWRKRKRRLDAAAAAIVLQDWLDEQRT